MLLILLSFSAHSGIYLVEGSIKLSSLAIFGTVGITGLSLDTFKDNWSPGYQNTNEAGVPDPEGTVYWNFK